ncbi:MAG: hypothetical protein ACRYFY_20965, partial [Janthinobacterium lividum]
SETNNPGPLWAWRTRDLGRKLRVRYRITDRAVDIYRILRSSELGVFTTRLFARDDYKRRSGS